VKVKLDENLPHSLAVALSGLGHDVHTTAQEGLKGRPDDEIWSAAQTEGRFLITQDLRFGDIRAYAPGTHAGVLLVRLNSPGWEELLARMEEIFTEEDVESWGGCLVVASDKKLRVRDSGDP